jgi:hypothetical protein
MPAEAPKLRWISATLPKAGNRPEENEDAIAAAPAHLRFAIADGASEGWESGPWAVRLVETYIGAAPTPADFSAWLAKTRRRWAPKRPAGPVAWYAAEKQSQGSFATLLGVELRQSRSRPGMWPWKAVAVGDSCLVHLRGDAVLTAFPHTTRAEFGDRPPLVPSSARARCPAPEWLAGHAEADDLIVLATDAAAAHLLDAPARAAALSAIRASLSKSDRAPLEAWFRDIQRVMNDDVSVIAIRVPGAAEVP